MSKVYHHRIPGARFIMPDGKDISFAGGSVDLASIPEFSRAAVEAELDKVADQPSSMIYTKKPVEGLAERQAMSETRDAAVTAFDSTHKVPPNTKTIAMPMAAPQKPVLATADATVSDVPAGSDVGTDLQEKIRLAKEKVAGSNAAPSVASK